MSSQPLTTRRRLATAESYTQWTVCMAPQAGCVDCAAALGASARPDARAKGGLTPAGIAKKYGRDRRLRCAQTPLDTYPVAVPETGGTDVITPCPGKRREILV